MIFKSTCLTVSNKCSFCQTDLLQKLIHCIRDTIKQAVHILFLFQECLNLSVDKVRLSLKHASIVRDLENLETSKREQSHSMQDLEVRHCFLKNFELI